MRSTQKKNKSPKISEAIARTLRKRIIENNMGPGDALPSEVELIEEFNVSRPTLREAFRILEAQHLVHIVRGTYGGARVSLPEKAMVAEFGAVYLQSHRTTFGDLQEARVVIEPRIVRLLAAKITAEGLARLRAVIDEHRAAIDDPEAFLYASQHFSEVLVELTENNTLALLLSIIHEVLKTHTLQAQRQIISSFPAVSESRADHIAVKERLVELLEKGDADAVEHLWARHLEALRRLQKKAGIDTALINSL